jgi:acyl carrier protein
MSDQREAVRAILECIFRDIFDDEEIQLRYDMSADDIEGWDSLMHITIIVSVEKRFGIRASAAEVGHLENVGAFIDLIIDRAGDRLNEYI